MLDGFQKADPPTTKQLPVEADVPEFLVQLGLSPGARKLDHAINNLTMIAFIFCYVLVSIPPKELKIIQSRQRSSNMGDITFFAKDKQGNCLAASPRMPRQT